MKEAVEPPAPFRLLLMAVAGDAHGELVAGDLHEEFRYLCAQFGRRAGNRWYAGQVMRSLPQLLRLRIRSGEFTHVLAAFACAAVPLLLLDRLWCFIYSMIPLKDGTDRAAGLLAANVAVVMVAAALCGAMAPSARRVALISAAVMAGAGVGVWGSLGAAPVVYVGAVLILAPASSLAGFVKWRDR